MLKVYAAYHWFFFIFLPFSFFLVNKSFDKDCAWTNESRFPAVGSPDPQSFLLLMKVADGNSGARGYINNKCQSSRGRTRIPSLCRV